MDALPTNHLVSELVQDDGTYPNNSQLPLLVYPKVVQLIGQDPAAIFENQFAQNHWGQSWRNGIFSYHHYHSQAHEVLGIYGGSAEVQFGGEQGPIFSIKPGDVVIIPAGVAHKKLNSSFDFRVVGAYPIGRSPDVCYGKPGERPQADQSIAQVPLPKADPIYGKQGPLIEKWR